MFEAHIFFYLFFVIEFFIGFYLIFEIFYIFEHTARFTTKPTNFQNVL